MRTHDDERYRSTKRVAMVSAVVNLLLSVLKIVGGVFGLSTALIADGIHSLSDLLCDGIVMIAAHFASHEADEDHPYGHHRFETVATFLLGVVLMLVAIFIAFDAVKGIVGHRFQQPDTYTVIIAIVSIFANEWLFRYSMSAAKRLNSSLLKANAWHNRGDAFSSVIVLVGLLGAIAGWPFLDKIAAVLVALFIGKIGIEWSGKAFGEFTEKGLAPDVLNAIKICIAGVDGVIALHQLRSRTMADKILLDVHILIDSKLSASEGHYIAEGVHFAVAKQFREVYDITVHVDVENHAHVLPETLLPSREKLLAQLAPEWAKYLDLTRILAVNIYYQGHERIDLQIILRDYSESESQALLPKLTSSKSLVPALESISVLMAVVLSD